MYNVGDKVRILSRQEIMRRFACEENELGLHVFGMMIIFSTMYDLLGSVVTVTGIIDGEDYYIVEIDGGYVFAPRLIELYEDKPKPVNLSLTLGEYESKDILHGATVGELRQYLEQFDDRAIISVTVPYHLGVYGIKATFDFD